MKPIIWDINEMTDSTEVYESRPNPFLTGTIYLILAIVAICLLWMYLAKIDIVVKGNGVFKGEESGVNVSCGISGKIKTCDVTDGQYVEEGQTLFTLEVDSLENSIESCEEELIEVDQRITMLNAYLACLDGEEGAMDTLSDNPYYSEFKNRKELLDASIEVTDENVAGQRSQYQTSVDNAESSIQEYEDKITRIKKAIACIKERKNTFKKKESYYHSIVSSYIANYENVSLQYDNQIAAYQSTIDAAEQEKLNLQQMAQTEMSAENVEAAAAGMTSQTSTVEALNIEIQNATQNMDKLKTEKKTALQSMELEQVAALEQERASAQSAIKSLEANVSTSKAQIESLNSSNPERADDVAVMTEKNNVAAELLTYQNKKKECENNLNSLKVQDGNCQMVAATSGYVMMQTEVENGMYVQQGTAICQILPEEHGGYYAEVYVENQDVAKLEEGQEVKFEIAAYPSNEYGYFTGTLDSISKDVRVDQNTGSSYYVAKVLCDKITVTNEKGQTGTIQNGMACQAKVVVDAQRVWNYVMEKINLVD